MLIGAWPVGGKTAHQKNGKCKFLFLCLTYIFMLVIGASIFSSIEAPKIEIISKKVDSFRQQFLDNNKCVSDDDLEEFLAAVQKANDRGISLLRNYSDELNWSFGQSLFFSSTVITTIGYGHVTPLSQEGKIFCMIYAAIGIPLTLILLSACVEKLLGITNGFLWWLNSKLGHLYQPFNIRLLHLLIIYLFILILFFAIPTAVFAYLEPEWGILDAFYYCFISLTTIGLGDYIPGEGVKENRSLYKICTTVYLIFGLIAMMLALTIFYDVPQLNYLGQLFTTENTPNESEKLRSGKKPTLYTNPSSSSTSQLCNPDEVRRVKIRSHAETPSPEPTEQIP